MRSMTVLALAALAGCSSSLSAAPDGGNGGIPPELASRLAAASSTWAATKSACSTYSYDRRVMSVFGSGGSTEVEITNDLPTRRRQSSYARPEADGGSGWTVVWDETGDQVGVQHPGLAGFPASTVEQLLAECATVLAHDPAAYDLFLTVNDKGVPTTCTNYPHGCADDCTSGITIQTFACAALAN